MEIETMKKKLTCNYGIKEFRKKKKKEEKEALKFREII